MTLPSATTVTRLLPFMPEVGKCERSLQELNLMWRMIEASAKMHCPREAKTILPTVRATREGVSQLEQELVTSLVHEKTNTALAEMASKAQYIIDIVVRNLYERTADVGFLATDHELCAFVAGLTSDAAAVRARLASYRSKYSVYDEILLLAPDGRVLAQVDPAAPIERSMDPLLAQTLASDTYVETFRASDLRPDKREALIYSQRMRHPETGAVTGILCLCFHFEEEMARIFHTHRDLSERAIMLLLDAGGSVIASADPLWIPVGGRVPVNRDGSTALRKYAGRDYLICSVESPGYQGYPGPPGWQGQVMIPIDVAFGSVDSSARAGLAPEWIDGLLSHAPAFCTPLAEIIVAANMIRRVVWNGQVMSADQRGDLEALESILEQISETGARSNTLFKRSIGELLETVLGSGMNDAEFASHLMVDLLDRNLYERANDCRWWALSPELRQMLASDLPERGARMARALAYIHGLYTVYSALVVYDCEGVIIASSGPCGVQRIEPDTLAAVRALRSEQDYYVTPFVASPLYEGRPTYVYHAAIRAPANENAVIGGIGIVFNSAVELEAMLCGAIGQQEGVQAYFVDRDGAILASTNPARPVGSLLDGGSQLMTMPNGRSGSRLLSHDEQYALMAATVSHGYREFKVTDGYTDDILAVVVRSFGAVTAGPATLAAVPPLLETATSDVQGREFGTFLVGGALFAMAAGELIEACSAAALSPVTMAAGSGCIGILALDGRGGAESVWVYDLSWLVSGQYAAVDGNAQVVLVRNGTRTVGLLVGDLHGVGKFAARDLIPVPMMGQERRALISHVIKANQGELLIQVINSASLFELLEAGEGQQCAAA
ncbi:MAG: chemotaxis protein CheW [Sphingomonadaceae bacterium]